MTISIRIYDDALDRVSVIRLWNSVFDYESAHNVPDLVIDRKLAVDNALFLVAIEKSQLAGTVMAGYDGHRGWIYSLAVDEQLRNRGIGSSLLSDAEKRLDALGCLKINLQIAEGNENVQSFYTANGYTVEQRVSMGKRLIRE